MSFLNPWLWLGLLAVAAPLWLHLRRRADPGVIRFSALKFLDDQPTPSVAPRRVQDIPLLLLRLLAVILLVAGFTWPFVQTPETREVSESRVYVMDSTLSQQAGGNFGKCKELLLSEIQSAGSKVQIALVELGSRARVLHQFSDDPAALVDKVRALQPTAARGPILEAVRAANGLLQQSLGENRNIIVLSDLQSNQWEQTLNTAPFLDGVTLQVRGFPGVTERPNLSLAHEGLNRIFRGDRPEADLLVRVQRQGMVGPGAVLQVRVNGVMLESRPVLLSPTDAAVLHLRIPTPRDTWTLGEVRLDAEGDALAADNSVRFSLPPVREGRASLLSQSPFLRVALSPEIMKGRWQTRLVDLANPEDEARHIEDCDVLVVDSGYLASLLVRDLVQQQLNNGRGVLLLTNQLTPAAIAFLRGLDFEARELTPEQLAPMSPLAPRPGAPIAPAATNTRAFRYFATNHPIFQPFLMPDFANLQGVALQRYFGLGSATAVPLLFSYNGAPLMFEGTRTKGRLLVTAFGFEKGFTDWMTQPSFLPFIDLCLQHIRAVGSRQFSLTPGEVQVVAAERDNAVAAVVRRIDTGGAIPAPAVLPSAAAPLAPFPRAPLGTPGTNDVPAPPPTPRTGPSHALGEVIARYPLEAGKASVRAPDLPGQYAVELEGAPVPASASDGPGAGSPTNSAGPAAFAPGTRNATEYRMVIDVNPDPRESDLRYTESPQVIQSWVVAHGVPGGDSANASRPASGAAAVPVAAETSLPAILAQSVWWWLLLAAFAFLALETGLLAWRTALRPRAQAARPLFRRHGAR
ncbi:hypothetical protein DB346_06405 [Verrucomicrobia bacterium LW23]|nr:hypothetical protein DB346_06405 [Verrucomicrobia bacterium LW23]